MKTLVENCFVLDIKLVKKNLHLVREHRGGVAGYFNIVQGEKQSVADYCFDYTNEFDYLIIQYGEKDQRIKLATSELRFGERSWFVCKCGNRVSKLYLPPGKTEFKCRHCYRLSYEVQNLNKNSKSGQFLYKNRLILKLMNSRENMRSIFYDGKLTQRYSRFLKQCDTIGLNYSEDARKLLLAMSHD